MLRLFFSVFGQFQVPPIGLRLRRFQRIRLDANIFETMPRKTEEKRSFWYVWTWPEWLFRPSLSLVTTCSVYLSGISYFQHSGCSGSHDTRWEVRDPGQQKCVWNIHQFCNQIESCTVYADFHKDQQATIQHLWWSFLFCAFLLLSLEKISMNKGLYLKMNLTDKYL